MSRTEKVQLAVYDLSQGMASSMSQAILGQQIDGIWHTGVVVYSKEYFFSGGIQCLPIGGFAATNGMRPVQMLDIGVTEKTEGEFQEFLRSVSHRFTQQTYNLLRHNCNNFSDEVCKFLTTSGTGIPEHIINLPSLVFNTPGGRMLLPMFENMERNISRHGGSLDPFHSTNQPSNSQNHPVNSQHSTNSSVVGGGGDNIKKEVNDKVEGGMREELEKGLGKFFVSSDDSSVSTMVDKILKIAGNNTKNVVDDTSVLEGKGLAEVKGCLTETERLRLKNLVSEIKNFRQQDKPYQFGNDIFVLMLKLLTENPKTHFAVLYITRLLFLFTQETSSGFVDLLKEIQIRMKKCESNKFDHDSFYSYSSQVMAVCCLINLLTHASGADLLRKSKFSDTSLLDLTLQSLHSPHVEVKRMSATLAYNFLVFLLKDEELIVKSKSEEELPVEVMQLLCVCLEEISNEVDQETRFKKLCLILLIFRIFGIIAISLVTSLDLSGQLLGLRDKLLGFNELTSGEKKEIIILKELCNFISS